MAQTFPTSAEVIYDTLVADGAFMALVGNYTFVDGTSLPSISVKSPGADLPHLKSQLGLEVIIADVGDVLTRPYYTGSPDTIFTWSVYLIAFEPANSQVITDAVTIMVSKFLGLTSIDTLAASDGIGALSQTKVFIKSDMPIIG